MFPDTLLSRPESLRCAGRSFSRVARTRAWIRSRGRRAPSAVSRRSGSVVQAEFIMLASHLAPLGRHVPIQPSDIGIVSRFGFYLAFVGSDAELFRLRLDCVVIFGTQTTGVESKSDSTCGSTHWTQPRFPGSRDGFCWDGSRVSDLCDAGLRPSPSGVAGAQV